MFELDEHAIQDLYAWIDSIPLSRSKKNIARDFSDGVACAECIKYFIPKLLDMHNYSAANSVAQKLYNWNTLNQRVFKKLHYSTSEDIINSIVHCRPGYIEYLLYELRQKSYLTRKPLEGRASKSKNNSSINLHRIETSKQPTTIFDSRVAEKYPQEKRDESKYSDPRELAVRYEPKIEIDQSRTKDTPTKKKSNSNIVESVLPNQQYREDPMEMRETINVEMPNCRFYS